MVVISLMSTYKISFPKKCEVIAEIGINHNGDIDIAKKLIDMAKRTGCDYVKFQKRDIETVYTKEFLAEKRESQWGNTQRDQKEGLEFNADEYDIIDKYCKKLDIKWFASAWDVKSLEFLDRYKPQKQKIASAMITNKKFIKEVARRKIHTFISTGMTHPKNIEDAVNLFKKESCDFTLMHSVSTYPCKPENLHLKNILHLRNKYKCDVGYSGHETSPGPSAFAVAFGSKYIERHITLDRTMYGSDQAASLEEKGLKILIDMVELFNKSLGHVRTDIYPEELPIAKKLRYWEQT